MATLNLIKPNASAQSVLPITDQITDYTFDFDLFEAIIEKIDDNLVITFDADGSSIVLEDFYAVYNAEFMPNFVLDGELVSGEDFFNAMDPNLMPAAGPAQGEVTQDANGVYSTGEGTLASGTNALGGRDGGSSYNADPTVLVGGGTVGGGDTGGSDSNPSSPNIAPTLSFGKDKYTSDTITTYDDPSADSNTGRTETGSFTFTPGNGPADVTINGESIFDENGDFMPGTEIETPLGKLTVESYDVETGEVTYTYEQNGAHDHSEDENLSDEFKVEVKDQDGDIVTGTITVEIEDDAPIALDDYNIVTEDGVVTTGNLLEGNEFGGKDDLSADGTTLTKVELPDTGMEGWTQSGSLAGGDLTFTHPDKGSITIGKDGSYEFKYTDQSLGEGQTEDFTFEYTITDSDGDSSSAKLEIEASGSNDVPTLTGTSINGVVLETFDDTSEGSREDSGVITFDSAESMDGGKITIGDETFTVKENEDGSFTLSGDTVSGTAGSLTNITLTGQDGSYELTFTYKQDGAYQGHDDKADASEKDLVENFEVKIQDGVEGSEAKDLETTIKVEITDDGPSLSVSAPGAVTEGFSSTGSLNYDFGADDGASASFTVKDASPTTDGGYKLEFGTVYINDDNTYTFEAFPNTDGKSQDITFVVTDSDGDTKEVTVNTGTINNSTAPTLEDKDFIVDETGLEDSKDGSESVTVSKENWLGEENTATVGTYDVKDDHGNTVGTATVDKEGNITLKLTDTTSHEDKADHDDAVTGKVTVEVTDAQGNIHDVELDVTIKDDGPSFEVVSTDGVIHEKFLDNGTEAGQGNTVATGTIDIDFGSDKAASADSFAWDLDNAPALKTSDDNEAIEWSYGDDKTTLIGKDADGEMAVKVEMNTETGEYTVTLEQAVEHHVPDGTESEDYNKDIDLDGSADKNSPTDVATDLNFGFTVTDGDGDTAKGDVTVHIEDDVIDGFNVNEAGERDDVVDLDASADLDVPDTGFFNGSASSDDLLAALKNPDAVEGGATTDTATTDAWNSGQWKGAFYDNMNEDKASITVGEGDNSFTITGVRVQNGEIVSDASDNIVLGWREDRSTSKDVTVDLGYADGIGMSSNNYTAGSEYEVAANGSYEDGAEVEALVIKLPEGQTAYGVDINFGCLFNKTEDGGSSVDTNGEFVTLEFYKDGELVYTVKQLAGVSEGTENFNTSTVTEQFDEVRIIPSEKGSDFVLTGVNFEAYDNNIIASGSGQIETTGADGLASASLESITIGTSTVTFDADGNASSTIWLDGKEMDVTQMGENVFVATYTDPETGEKSDYFTATVGTDGSWTVYQHEHFGDEIKLEIGIKDNDGDYTTTSVTVAGDKAPEAFDDVDNVMEGGEVSGNVIAGTQDESHTEDVKNADTAGDGETTLDSVKAPLGWATMPTTGDEVAKFSSTAGTITFDKNGNYTFESNPDSTMTDVSFEFDYTITDADGDKSSASLTINVDDVTLTPHEETGEVTTEDFNLNVAVKVDITLPEGMSFVEGELPKSEYGEFSVSADGSLYFTQTKAYDDPNSADNGRETDAVTQYELVIQDANGNQTTTKVDLNIVDDAPSDHSNVNSITTETTTDTATTILNIDFAADDGAGKELTIDGVTFTYNEDGSWTAGEGGSVSVNENGSSSLVVTDENGYTTTLTEGTNGGDLWTSTITGIPEDGQKDVQITVKDSDGDTTDFSIEASRGDTSANMLVGLDSDTVQTIQPGANYNIAIILDNSGSMYDDDNRDIDDYDTDGDGIADTVSRLGQACDAISDFIVNTLHTHATSDLGGEVNLLVTTFWERSENGASDVKNSGDNQSSGATYIETIDPADFAGMSSDEIYSQIAEILAMSSVGVSYDAETGEFNYDKNAHEELTEALKDPNQNADDVYNPLNGNQTGFHWGTEYHQGFETAAEWFEQVSQEGFTNEAFLITDGVPYDSELEREIAYTKLLDAMGIEYEQATDADGNPLYVMHPTTGNPYLVNGQKVPINVATEGQEDKIQAVGVGSGANQNMLDRFDTTTVDPETGHNSVIVEDSNISDLFKPAEGEIATSQGSTSIGTSSHGNDVMLGDYKKEDLINALESKLGVEVTDQMVIEYIQNYPDWLDSTVSSDAGDSDLLLAGTGDDIIHAQGGNDFIIGDANSDLLADLAIDVLGMTTSEGYTVNTESTATTTLEITDSEAFVEDFIAAAKEMDVNDLAEAAFDMESLHDGDDLIFGGDGDDIILGLGGDDTIYGGEGADIIFAGTGADTIYGGSGDDTIFLDSTGEEGSYRTVELADGSEFTGNVDDIISFDDALGSGNDTIHNFDQEHDLLDLSGLGLSKENVTITQEGDDAIIELSIGDIQQTITLVGAGEDVADIQDDLGTDDSFIKL